MSSAPSQAMDSTGADPSPTLRVCFVPAFIKQRLVLLRDRSVFETREAEETYDTVSAAVCGVGEGIINALETTGAKYDKGRIVHVLDLLHQANRAFMDALILGQEEYWESKGARPVATATAPAGNPQGFVLNK